MPVSAARNGFGLTIDDIDDSAVVRGVTALLGQLDYVNVYSLQPGGCGCMLPAALDQIILFCKGSCTVNADDGALRCEECESASTAKLLRFQEGLFAVSIVDATLGKGEEVTGMGEESGICNA